MCTSRWEAMNVLRYVHNCQRNGCSLCRKPCRYCWISGISTGTNALRDAPSRSEILQRGSKPPGAEADSLMEARS